MTSSFGAMVATGAMNDILTTSGNHSNNASTSGVIGSGRSNRSSKFVDISDTASIQSQDDVQSLSNSSLM